MSRDTEMDWILAKLKRPEPAAFVLAGAPGVGKTRLAAEAAKSAAGLGFTTAQAVASRAAAAIPFGPFAPFLPEAGYSPGDLLGLLRKASDAILERAGPDRRLLLVVDDAQFLDEGSAALVHQLVQKGACSVLASLRTPGPAPEPVTALWKDGLAERIDLTTWGEPETGDVAAATAVLDEALGSRRACPRSDRRLPARGRGVPGRGGGLPLRRLRPPRQRPDQARRGARRPVRGREHPGPIVRHANRAPDQTRAGSRRHGRSRRI